MKLRWITRVLSGLALGLVTIPAASAQDAPPASSPVEVPALPGSSAAAGDTTIAPARKKVVVIPIHNEIADPILYVVRRGLKTAIDQGAHAVVLDMKTPGGSLGTTLEIMEALDRFEGEKITFVNNEAVSAGAIIASVTDEIYFEPNGVMGAAEVITGTGADIGESLKRKINSYMNAKIAAFAGGGDPRRAEVLKAMMNPDFELKIGDEVIKPKGELLTVTARQAIEPYGDPPTPLLGAGIADSIERLLESRYEAGSFEVTRLEVTWSETFARWLNNVSALLLGLGLLSLYIEFKTPGFGIFGLAGITLLLLVFFGSYVAGFSGHEPLLLFGLGLVLIAAELFFFPGVGAVAMTGLLCVVGSLLWAMADLWPDEPIAWDGSAFGRPLANLGLGIVFAVGLAVALARFLPRGWLWDRMILASAVGGAAQVAGAPAEARASLDALVGQRGVAVTGLFPSGQVEIAGQRYEARIELGHAEPGTPIVVRGRQDFALIVEKTAAA